MFPRRQSRSTCRRIVEAVMEHRCNTIYQANPCRESESDASIGSVGVHSWKFARHITSIHSARSSAQPSPPGFLRPIPRRYTPPSTPGLRVTTRTLSRVREGRNGNSNGGWTAARSGVELVLLKKTRSGDGVTPGDIKSVAEYRDSNAKRGNVRVKELSRRRSESTRSEGTVHRRGYVIGNPYTACLHH